MSEWTEEARDYLEGYLRQVGALARHQDDDAEEIVGELRAHIEREAEEEAGAMVTLDHLRKTLAAIGTPEQVLESDTPLAAAAPKPAVASGSGPPPVQPAPAPVIIQQAKSRTGCWIFAAVVFLVLILIGIPVLLTMLAITIPATSRAREAARRSSCANNLKQMGIVLKNYAGEHDGAFPVLAPELGRFMFKPEAIVTEYMSDPRLLMCPSDQSVPGESNYQDPSVMVDDYSYFYLGHAVTNEEEGGLFIEAYRAAIDSGESLDVDFALPGGISAAEIPIMFDRPDNHQPGGGNVLYLDGHIEFVKMGTKFPMTREFIDSLEALEMAATGGVAMIGETAPPQFEDD